MAWSSSSASSAVAVEPAKAEDCAELSAQALRSKAHWGYDQAFLDACREELTSTPERMATETMLVARHPDGRIAGFVSVAVSGSVADLMDLFVDPDHIGAGTGKQLWEAAVAASVSAGATRMTIEADPNAEAWYHARGAVRIGEAPSESIPGRMLPLLELILATD